MHSEPVSPHFDASMFISESNLLSPSPALWNQLQHGLNNDFVPEYRINEALKLNTKKLVGLSQQKKGTSQNFFTKPQTKDRAGTIYRVTYGDDVIPKASESEFRSTMIKSGPYIPPAYKNYKSHQLPTFLKEKINEQNKPKRIPLINTSSSSILPTMSDQPMANRTLTHAKSGNLPTISPNSTKSLGFLSKDLLNKYSKVSSYESVRSMESSDFQYLSPKARKQMKSEPILMSSVFLTGQIHPEGVAPSNEAAVEHIISEHHGKAKIYEDYPNISRVSESHQMVVEAKSPKKKLDKFSVAWSLAQQEKKKKEGEAVLYNKEPKANVDKVGMKLKATVGQLRMERELKRKKILNILKTKNFNLFRPNTINNLHLLKDAL